MGRPLQIRLHQSRADYLSRYPTRSHGGIQAEALARFF